MKSDCCGSRKTDCNFPVCCRPGNADKPRCRDSHPATAGLFELNGTLDFRFGPRLAEVDLLARTLRLAAELDGGFWHLRDRECYRRDRRKDWELQRRGFLVLRFLAEDVVYRPQGLGVQSLLAA
jgi:hypothetical protein